jgi:hypothetical protein
MRIIKITSLLIISLILSISCKKDSNSSSNPMQFTFTGTLTSFGDVTIKQNETIPSDGIFDFVVKQTGGDAEDVTISATGLPIGITFSPNLPQTYVASLFSLNQNTNISLVSLSANSTVVGGVYPIVITAKSSSGSSKSINFNLIVETCNVTETTIQGSYNGSWKMSGIDIATDNITITDSANNRVNVQSVFYGFGFKATLNGITLTSDSVIVASATTSAGTLTNVRAKAIGTFDCAVSPLNITLQIAKGTMTLGNGTTLPLNGQALTGTFTK